MLQKCTVSEMFQKRMVHTTLEVVIIHPGNAQSSLCTWSILGFREAQKGPGLDDGSPRRPRGGFSWHASCGSSTEPPRQILGMPVVGTRLPLLPISSRRKCQPVLSCPVSTGREPDTCSELSAGNIIGLCRVTWFSVLYLGQVILLLSVRVVDSRSLKQKNHG